MGGTGSGESSPRLQQVRQPYAYGEYGLTYMPRARFTKNSRIRNVLFDCGESRETGDPKGPIPRTPTTETVPRCHLAIGVGIVHKLWRFV